MIREHAAKLRSYLDAYIANLDAIASARQAIADAENPSLTKSAEAVKQEEQNKILASGGDKAALFGDISTVPTVTAKTLTDYGLAQEEADGIIAERDKIRTEALAFTGLVGIKEVEAVVK